MNSFSRIISADISRFLPYASVQLHHYFFILQLKIICISYSYSFLNYQSQRLQMQRREKREMKKEEVRKIPISIFLFDLLHPPIPMLKFLHV